MRCFVLCCRNSSLNHPEGVTFHKIPEDRYSEWLEAIKRPSDTLPHSSRRICSEHFTPDSFIPLRGRLRTLKPHVIPTLKLTQSQLLMRIQLNMPESQPSTSRKENLYEVETKRKLIPSSSDSEGLRRSPKRRRKLVSVKDSTYYREPVLEHIEDFEESDLEIKSKRHQYWNVSQQTFQKYRKRINYLRTKLKKQNEKIRAMNSILNDLKKKQ